ncbi:alpha/beta fold hydrolase [Zavarzinia sp. CC-PAN008]|uniref:alpha/beta fold hydrolase n=1 Tax=Zavarzinia sp. CC-PAN008 TaxID=3243332 RepID=UPI003F749648
MSFIAANGIRLWHERRGVGAPLLVISGTNGDLRRKPSVLDAPIARAFDTLAYDQRGLGQSDKPDGPYAMADYADDAAALLTAVGWPRAHLVGISFGGMVAQELAIRHPGLIDRLVLCCTAPGGAGGASYPLHEVQHMDAAARARLLVPIMDARHDAAWAAAHPVAHEALLTAIRDDPFAGEERRALGQRLQLEARAGHDTWDRLGRIAAPTLICAGRHDRQAPPEVQHALANRIAGARLDFFDGGHLFLMQDPAAWRAIAAFLADGVP